MYDQIGRILMCLRKSWQMTRDDVVEQMKLIGIPISSQTINSWEHDVRKPSSEQFLGLCQVYKVRDVLSTFADIERSQKNFELNHEGWRRIEEFAQILKASGLFHIQDNVYPFSHRYLPVYSLNDSAETNLILLSRDYDMIENNPEIPANANFGIRFIGDSMEPKLKNHQIVWVQQQKKLRNNEIGVFVVNGNVYIRQWHPVSNMLNLRALNHAYSTITIIEGDDLQIIGKVLLNDEENYL